MFTDVRFMDSRERLDFVRVITILSIRRRASYFRFPPWELRTFESRYIRLLSDISNKRYFEELLDADNNDEFFDLIKDAFRKIEESLFSGKIKLH